MSWYIYALCDPRISDPVQRVRYVGATKNYKQRLKTHIGNRHKHKNHMACWLRWLLDTEKLKPAQILLQEGPEDWSAGLWEAAEIYWIAHYKQAGAKLCNSTSGGEGAKTFSPETLARMREAQRNCPKERQERINASIKAAHARGAYANIDFSKRSQAQIAAAQANAAKWTPEVRKRAVERSVAVRQTTEEAKQLILSSRKEGLSYREIIEKMNESTYKPSKGGVWSLATIAGICRQALSS